MRNSSDSSAISSSEITMCSSVMRIDHRYGPGRKQSSAGESADSAASISRLLKYLPTLKHLMYVNLFVYESLGMAW